MFVVDTNVFVAAANTHDPSHAACRAAVERWRLEPGAWFTTWSVVYEFIRVMTHRRVLPRPWNAGGAWGFIESLLASPGFRVLVATPRHPAVAAQVIHDVPDIAGKFAHDAHIAILMREHGIRRIYTRDTDFFRFPFLEPIDPLRPAPPGGTAEPVARYRGSKRRRSPST